MNNSDRYADQTVMEPIARGERGGTGGANLPKAKGPDRSRRWRLIVMAGILIAGAVAIYLDFNSGKKQPARRHSSFADQHRHRDDG